MTHEDQATSASGPGAPLARPKRKNPVLRTPQLNLPPGARGRVALGLTAAAAEVGERLAERLLARGAGVEATA